MMDNLTTYIWFLIFVFSAIFTLYGILSWIKDDDVAKRKKKLIIISSCSCIVFVVLLLHDKWGVIYNNLGKYLGADSIINISKLTIKILFIVLIVAISLIIAVMAVLLVKYSTSIIFDVFEKDTAGLEDELKEKTARIGVFLKTPVFIISIVGGILILYLIVPLIIGEKTQGLAGCWMDGVSTIVDSCTGTENEDNESADNESVDNESAYNEFAYNESADNESADNEFAYNVSVYSLIFILILGIGYGAVNILFEIIKERFEKKAVFLNEYSVSIGLLAVGISILLLISQLPESLKDKHGSELLFECSKPFIIVIFIIALGILILEIVRLLMDMREKIIRHEARYLFVLVVGLSTVVIMKAFLIIYNSISSVLSGESTKFDTIEESIQSIWEQILENVTEDMEEEIETDSQRKDGKVPYRNFKGKITKK